MLVNTILRFLSLHPQVSQPSVTYERNILTSAKDKRTEAINVLMLIQE